MKNMDVVLEKISFVEQGFFRFAPEYCFEKGVIYNDNGEAAEYNKDELLEEVKEIMEALENECKDCIQNRQYRHAKDDIMALERLSILLEELIK